jgi:hypothetical protein
MHILQRLVKRGGAERPIEHLLSCFSTPRRQFSRTKHAVGLLGFYVLKLGVAHHAVCSSRQIGTARHSTWLPSVL